MIRVIASINITWCGMTASKKRSDDVNIANIGQQQANKRIL